VSYRWRERSVVGVDLESLDDGGERDHGDGDGEHEPAETVCPARVDVVTERDRRVVDRREHEQKLQPRATTPALSSTPSQQNHQTANTAVSQFK